MKKFKNNKAITLIALVITIIILLILAGISIAQLTGNGLFEKAKLAKEVSKNAQEDEDDKIKQYGNEINSYIGANREYTPISYSTSEQDTGLKWIDGKTIYQKTITGDLSSTADYMHFADSSFAIDQIIETKGFLYKSGQGQMQLGCYLNSNYYNGIFNNEVDGKKTIYYSSNFRGGAYKITIQYTKATN